MLSLSPKFRSKRSVATAVLSGGVLIALVTGCSPSTTVPIGATTTAVSTSTTTSQTKATWAPVMKSVQLGEAAKAYMEKVSVNITEGSIQSGFQVYGRINPPNKMDVAFHQNGANMAFYQQGLSAYGQMDGQWQQHAALSNINLYPEYAKLLQAVSKAKIPVFQLQPNQYVVDEFCNVYQATIPASLLSTLPGFSSTYHAANMSPVVYTFFVGQTSGELRQVNTSSEGSVTDVGSVQIQSNTILFNINKPGADITIDPTLYSSLLYQY